MPWRALDGAHVEVEVAHQALDDVAPDHVVARALEAALDRRQPSASASS
jgi:hypothetical protein